MVENTNLHNDEIDLRELFITLWKGKIKIISIALIVAIVVCLVTVFFIDPVYDTKMDILINMPESIETKYGTYAMLLTSNEQYIELFKNNNILSKTISDMGFDEENVSIENLSKKISITKDDKKPNSFLIKVSANTKAESLKLAQALYDNYISYIKMTIKETAAEKFYNYYDMQKAIKQRSLSTANKLLERNTALLATIPQTINSKEAINSIDTSTLDYVVLENAINTNYTKVEADIITGKQLVNSLETDIDLYNDYINELGIIIEQLKSGNEEVSFCNTINTSIKLSANPVGPSQKTSPRTALNTVIGGVIGGMIGIIYVLIKEYWFSEAK